MVERSGHFGLIDKSGKAVLGYPRETRLNYSNVTLDVIPIPHSLFDPEEPFVTLLHHGDDGIISVYVSDKIPQPAREYFALADALLFGKYANMLAAGAAAELEAMKKLLDDGCTEEDFINYSLTRQAFYHSLLMWDKAHQSQRFTHEIMMPAVTVSNIAIRLQDGKEYPEEYISPYDLWQQMVEESIKKT